MWLQFYDILSYSTTIHCCLNIEKSFYLHILMLTKCVHLYLTAKMISNYPKAQLQSHSSTNHEFSPCSNMVSLIMLEPWRGASTLSFTARTNLREGKVKVWNFAPSFTACTNPRQGKEASLAPFPSANHMLLASNFLLETVM